MKRIASILILGLLITAGAGSLCGHAYAADRAMWVWSMSEKIVLDDPTGSRAEFFSFCDSPHGSTVNLVANPGVETGSTTPTGWTTYGNQLTDQTGWVTPPPVDNTPHSGSRCLKIVNTGNTDAGWTGNWITISGTTTKTLTFSGWSKADSVTGGLYGLDFAIEFTDGTSTYYMPQDVYFSKGTHDWEYRSVTATFTKAVAYVKPYALLYCSATYGGGSGTVWFDDISVSDPSYIDPAKKITTVYLSSTSYQKDLLLLYPEQLRGFISAAKSRGMKVECLDGSKYWATVNGTGMTYDDRVKGEARIDAILAFNKGGSSDAERFDGIHLDVEPQNFSASKGDPYDWNNDNAALWSGYLILLTDCRDKVAAYNASMTDITLAADIAWWLDVDSYSGTSLQVQQLVDYVTLMDYRDDYVRTATPWRPLIFDGAQTQLNNAYTLGKKVYIGVETSPAVLPDPETITFFEEGNAWMEQVFADTIPFITAAGRTAAFGGFAIHYYEDISTTEWAYRKLLTDSSAGLPPGVQVLFPNGDEGVYFTPGTSYNIKWRAQDIDNPGANLNIKIEYTASDTGPWTSITDSTMNTGSFAWNTTGLATGSNYRIRITATNPSGVQGYDKSDYVFSFSSTAPSPPEWAPGSNTTIDGLKPVIIPDGNILHMVWYTNWGSKCIYYRKSYDRGLTWGATVTLRNDSATEPRKPALAVRGNMVAVAWVEGAGTYGAQKVYVIISDKGGTTWDTPPEEVQGLYTSYKYADFPDICIDPNNDVHVVWGARYADDHAWVIHYVGRTAGTWGRSEEIFNQSSPGNYVLYSATPSITANGTDVQVVFGIYLWYPTPQAYYAIGYRKKTQFLWASPVFVKPYVTIASGNWNKYFPRICQERAAPEKLHVVWQTARDNPETDPPPTTSRVNYGSSVDHGGNWIASIDIGEGYVPNISVTGSEARVVYYVPNAATGVDPNNKGDIRAKKSADGVNWSAETIITADAKAPYWSAEVPVVMEFPSIASDSSGTTVTAWRAFSSGMVMFSYAGGFAQPGDLSSGLVSGSPNSLLLKWGKPAGYTPGSYSLYQSRDGAVYALRASNIYGLGYRDDGLLTASYYKYYVQAIAGAQQSRPSNLSNALYPGIEFLIDNFEGYEGLTYSKSGTSALTYAYDAADKHEGSQSIKIEFFFINSGWGSVFNGTFANPNTPSRLDLSPFNSMKFWAKAICPNGGKGDVDGNGFVQDADVTLVINHLNGGTQLTGARFTRADISGDGLITPIDALGLINYINASPGNDHLPPIEPGLGIPQMYIQIKENGGALGDETWRSPPVSFSGTDWTQNEVFFSEFTRVDVTPLNGGNFKLDLNRIGGYGISFSEFSDSGTYHVDQLRLLTRPASISVPLVNYEFAPNPLVGTISAHRFVLGPIPVTFGGYDSPWTIRIYTNNNPSSTRATAYKYAGLKGDDNIYYMPLKVWCINFGPEGKRSNAPPYPDENSEYFYNGYDFGDGINVGKQYQNGSKADAYVSGEFNETTWGFDINGDGDTIDTMITASRAKKISEEPSWARVPEYNEMDPGDPATWRRLCYAPTADLTSPFDIYLSVDTFGIKTQRYQTTTLTLEYFSQ